MTISWVTAASHYKAKAAAKVLNRRFASNLPPSLYTTLISPSDWADELTLCLDV